MKVENPARKKFQQSQSFFMVFYLIKSILSKKLYTPSRNNQFYKKNPFRFPIKPLIKKELLFKMT